MNLLEQRPWDHPAFVRFVVLPIIPFIVGALVIISLSYMTYQKDHVLYQRQMLAQRAEGTLPSARARTSVLDRINQYDTVLTNIYQQRAATSQALKPFSDLVALMPQSVHIKSIGLNGTTLTVTFQSMDRNSYIDLDTKLNKIGGHLDAPTTVSGDNGEIDLTATVTVPEGAK